MMSILITIAVIATFAIGTILIVLGYKNKAICVEKALSAVICGVELFSKQEAEEGKDLKQKIERISKEVGIEDKLKIMVKKYTE